MMFMMTTSARRMMRGMPTIPMTKGPPGMIGVVEGQDDILCNFDNEYVLFYYNDQ